MFLFPASTRNKEATYVSNDYKATTLPRYSTMTKKKRS
jgi:hypothetical protein